MTASEETSERRATWNIGALWHRWDPHIHVPGTIQNDQFRGDWEGFLKAVEEAAPSVEALGITDYCLLRSYREFIKRWRAGRAKNVKVVFPNIEFRLSVETEKKKGINLHLLVSPDDSNHEREIERILGALTFEYKQRPYRCLPEDLIELGRQYDPTAAAEEAALREGVKQFKLNFTQLQAVFRANDWARTNCLIAVAAGPNDGTAGLQKDDAFAALRQDLEAHAQIIFSGNPSDREFWLGQKPGFDRAKIEATYRHLKPCLHGSDAHEVAKVLRPDEDRFCWVRSELTFTGLKQTILEPAHRVSVGKEPPPGPSPSDRIQALDVKDAPWLGTGRIEFNDGLIAIIGPKGSGKTALADILAHAAGAAIQDESAFLLKAQEHLGDATAALTWGDGVSSQSCRLAAASETNLDGGPQVRYLSQQFVDRLCSADAIGTDLIREIEDVVFNATPDEERLDATTFEELRAARLDQVQQLRTADLAEIERITEALAREDEKKAQLPAKRARIAELKTAIGKCDIELKALLPKEKKKEGEELAEVQRLAEQRVREIQTLNLKVTKLQELAEHLAHTRGAIDRQFSELKREFSQCGIADADWEAFRPVIAKKADEVVAGALGRQRQAVTLLQAGVPGTPKDPKNPSMWPLNDLQAREKALTAAIGIEQQRAKKHREVQQRLVGLKREFDKLEREVGEAKQIDERRAQAIEERRKVYANVFESFLKEQAVLESLYAPLRKQLADDPARRRLEFYVRRRIDVAKWVAAGEDLLDLRRAGPFQGRGKLREVVDQQLLPAWRSGGAVAVADAMEQFIEKQGPSLMAAKAEQVSVQDIGRWLFSADHVTLEYGIKYDGVDISRLSPGMRGIVLLILYLAIDQWDTRPLLVDQPEENLDPQSVYEELVGYIRQAKRRRQVILVTHNPNLVVNADADQVIIAAATRESAEGLPTIAYTSGGLEDARTRTQVCRILEGGERAFLEREWRYALPRDYPASLGTAEAPQPKVKPAKAAAEAEAAPTNGAAIL